MRGFTRTLATAFLAGLAGVSVGGAAHAAKFKVLHSFCRGGPHHPCADGSNPQAGLVMDSAGNLFGVTSNGGREFGTVFELERKASGGFNFNTIFRFCTGGGCGQNPSGTLIVDTQGNLYGTADNLVFELSPQSDKKLWIEHLLYRFCSQQNCTDGSKPVGGLTYAGASSGAPYDGISPLYGVTAQGGQANNGTAFQLTNNGGNWTQSVLYHFCSQGGSQCTDGGHPQGGLVFKDGAIFGTAASGGGNNFDHLDGAGVAFELTSGDGTWTEAVLYRFCSLRRCRDGALPRGGLVLDATGALFGTAAAGGGCSAVGKIGCGTIFRLGPNGSEYLESTLHTFCAKSGCKDGIDPEAGLAMDSAGNLYGSTFQGGANNSGVIFKYSGTAGFKVLHAFCAITNCVDGKNPSATLLIDGSALYGTTSLGGQFGDANAGGVVFRLSAQQ